MSKISSVTFSHILKALEQHTSISAHEMLNSVSLSEESLDEATFLSSQKLSEIFYYCMHKTNDPSLSLKIGNSTSYHSLGLLGYLMINTVNLQAMIEKFYHYQQLISGFMKFHLQKEEEYFKLAIYINENPSIKVPSFHAEVHLSAILSILSQILSLQLIPDKTTFSSKILSNQEAYENIFGKNILLHQAENAIYFNKRKLSLPINHCNEKMLCFFEAQANDILQHLHETSWQAKVEKEILKYIGEYEMSIDFIAHKLNLSTRVLQNHLKSEGDNFRQILLVVRMELAQHYIKHTKLDLNSIALYLGYQESSSFYRAYKRYFQVTPNSLRDVKE